MASYKRIQIIIKLFGNNTRTEIQERRHKIILYLKNSVTELRNTIESFNSRLDEAQEKIQRIQRDHLKDKRKEQKRMKKSYWIYVKPLSNQYVHHRN